MLHTKDNMEQEETLLSMERQLKLRVMCDEIDSVSDVQTLRQGFKELAEYALTLQQIFSNCLSQNPADFDFTKLNK